MKMKNVWVLALTIVMLFATAACGGGGNGGGSDAQAGSSEEQTAGGDADTTASGATIAFIIPADDALGINDRGWIQMTWTGVQSYGDANGKTYTWYRPLDNSTQGYYDAMTTAINDGTEVIISLGSQPVEATIQAQNDYPDTYFIAVEPSGIEEYLTDNTYAIFHQVDEAGFLAGVAAVRGGFKDIGVLTGLDIPPMNIWSYGYIQGINYAAGELGITDIKVRHHYVNTSAASPEIQTLAASWYNDGCDIIIPMMAGGNPSLFASADAADKPCFGGDVDQGEQSEHILTGAVKRLEETVPAALASIYDGTFPGGTYRWMNVDDGMVGLATGHWRMDQFGYTLDDYNADLEAFKSDEGGQRSGILTEDTVRTDPNSDAFDALWAAMGTKNIEFTNIK
ncbi:MAG: BMP family ABC transporter substrate-binding protein [Clostridiales Family XIII bacterium]|jgi:basic membrane protein A|nr:BMP family ABC transporter substrate-binding protein [Clostridiales Family XIII bacterium]